MEGRLGWFLLNCARNGVQKEGAVIVALLEYHPRMFFRNPKGKVGDFDDHKMCAYVVYFALTDSV